MPTFIKKPVVVEAVQFWPHPEFAEWRRLDEKLPYSGYDNKKIGVGPDGVLYARMECGIVTGSGFVRLEPGDWICRQTINGSVDVWPVKPGTFGATYEPVDAPAATVES
jgi:hypothetical protein